GRREQVFGAAALALLALAPALSGEYMLVLLTEIVVFALFASSLQFLMGPGGMTSFGHAAYFGVGAYAAALLVLRMSAPMEIALLWRAAGSPFGYALRAGRDSPARADAIGIDVRRVQWAAFCLGGLLAGLAGALYAFSKGSISPESLAVPRSVDGLVMVLLGG